MKSKRVLTTIALSIGLMMTTHSVCYGYATMAKPAAQAQAAQPEAEAPAAPLVRMVSGKVVETMNSGGYTYANLEKDGKSIWVAFPVAEKLQVGQEITVQTDMQEGKYTSKSLNRTFERIIFSSGVVRESKPEMPQGHPALGAKQQESQASSAAKAESPHGTVADQGKAAPISGKVVEVVNAGTYTYLHLEKDGKKFWVGVPTLKVSIGQEVKLLPGQEFANFKSKSLNRTFESMILSGGVIPAQ